MTTDGATKNLERDEQKSIPVLEAAGETQDSAVQARLALELIIRRAVFARTGTCVKCLRVRISGDLVILSGRCDTYYRKQLAQEAALPFVGSMQLANSITVE